ncbi:MAG: sugar O-acetyltransferase [Christensenellales bacterium]
MNTYFGSDQNLKKENYLARKFTLAYNNMDPEDTVGHFVALQGFLGDIGENSKIYAPFYCDRGNKIHLGKNVTINYSATILDMDEVYIGDWVRIGPNCSIYTVGHPLNYKKRAERVCYTSPVYIGEYTWIGGNVTILPGVKIGNRCVIGANSLVTHDIPDDSLAFGSPCAVIRKLEEDCDE